MLEPPLVSVVVPAYLAEGTVGEAVRSALGQTLRAIEVIIVDDGSPDASAAAAATAAAGDQRLRIIRLPENRGVSAARNAGFAAAAGRWITPLDADDVMAPERLETLVRTADATGCDILVDDLLVPLDPATTVRAFGTERLSQTGPISAARYASYDRPYVGLSSMGFAKPLFSAAFLRERDVRYREHVYAGEDFDLVMQALLRGADLRFTPYAGYTYRRDRSTLSVRDQTRLRSAMVASSAELRAEALRSGDGATCDALDAREREMVRWFDFDAFWTALRSGALRSAVGRFLRLDDKRYAVIRAIANARYDAYLLFGVSLEKRKRERSR